ncbi:MAG: multidrug DMT transporter permease [Chloroflexota bacterium]
MTLTATLLILTSAFFHAGWNLVSKRSSPSLAFFALAATSGAVVMLPNLVFHRTALGKFPTILWGWVILTGMSQAVYLIGLAGAYRRGDISFAYPMARALPVLFVALITIMLGNGDAISWLGYSGMALIVIGCLVLPLITFHEFKLNEYFSPVYLFALLAAVGTTGYTMIDDVGLHFMRETPSVSLGNRSITLIYIALQTTSTAVFAWLVTVCYRPERETLRQIAGDRSILKTALITGVVIMATYGLALAAMAFVTNVSYVAAFRQLSIPIGAILGMTLQGEPRHRPKIIGITVILAGLILVGIG